MQRDFAAITPKEFAALIRADLERWTAIARELKLEPQ